MQINAAFKLLTSLTIAAHLLNVVHGNKVGTLFVIINSINNQDGKLANGDFCDGPTVQSHKCDMKLYVCYGPENSEDTVDSCAPEDIKELPAPKDMNVVNQSEFDEYHRRIRLDINDRFPGNVKIKMKIVDIDSAGKEQLIGNLVKVVTVPNYDNGRQIDQETFTAKRPGLTDLVVQVGLTYKCEIGHFKNDCSKSCQPSMTCGHGFYNCNAEGDRVCLYNFGGPTCTTVNRTTCPIYKGIGVSKWEGQYMCNGTNYDFVMDVLTVNDATVSGRGVLSSTGDNITVTAFNITGSQNLTSQKLELNGTAFTNSDPAFTDLPSLSATVNTAVMTGTMSVGDECVESPLTMARVNETIAECMYENDQCYRVGDAYNEFKCCCRDGFSGARCEKHPDLCVEGACKNGGECRNNPPYFQNYTCLCKPGTYGNRCEFLREDVNCSNWDPCENQSVCVGLNSGYYCRCKDGFYGRTCDKQTVGEWCRAGDVCKNGGVCATGTGGAGQITYFCRCEPTYTGVTCQQQVPQKPNSFRSISVASRFAKVAWDVPNDYDGAIDTYQIKCRVNDSHSTIVKSNAKDFYTNISWPSTEGPVTDLHPATQYQCQVRAAIDDKFGPYSDSAFFKTHVEAPPILDVPEVDYTKNTETTIFLTMPETISESGPITKYSLAVQRIRKTSRKKRSLLSLAERSLHLMKRSALDPMTAEMQSNLTDFNTAQANNIDYYIAAQYTNYRKNFTVGDNGTYGGFYNPPLTEGDEYKIYYGVTTEMDGVADTKYVEIGSNVKAERVMYPSTLNQAGMAAGLVLLCLVFILGILLFFICRASRKPKNDDRSRLSHTTEREGIDNPAHSTLAQPASPGIGTQVPATQTKTYSSITPPVYGSVDAKTDTDYNKFESTYGAKRH